MRYTKQPSPPRPPDDHAAVVVEDLHVRYGHTLALAGVSFTVPRGTVLALLGPNGAGKTTTVSVLATLRRPTSGRARVAGHDVAADPAAVRAAISVTGQETSVDDRLTGRENLRLLARLFGLTRPEARNRADDALELFGLTDAADRAVRTYSGGMRRRLDLAGGLLRPPQVLFLDEPTTGLDPRSRADVWSHVRDAVGQGTTVLLTTQYLDEADQLADHIAVVDHGRIVAHGSAGELKTRVGGAHLEFTAPDGAIWRTPTDGTVADARRILTTAPDDARWHLHTPTLDDVFLALTGHPAIEPEHRTGPEATEEAA